MSKLICAASIIALSALAGACTNDPTGPGTPVLPSFAPLQTVQASAETQAELGVSEIQIYNHSDGLTTVANQLDMYGVDADGNVVVAWSMTQWDRDQTHGLAIDLTYPEVGENTIEFDKASGEVTASSVTNVDALKAYLHPVGTDLEAQGDIPNRSLRCWGDRLVQGGSCIAAAGELGANLAADAVCVGSTMLCAADCCSGCGYTTDGDCQS